MMRLDLQILFLLSALGAFNGFVLGGYLMAGKGRRSPAAFFLGLMLMMISIRVGKSAFAYFNPALPKIYLQIGLSACFLIGPSLFYFLKASLSQAEKTPASWKWIWCSQLAVISIVGTIWPYEQYPALMNRLFVYIIYAQWGAWLIAGGWLLARNGGLSPAADRFRMLVFAGSVLLYAVYLAALLLRAPLIYIASPVFFSFMLLLTVLFQLKGAGVQQAALPPRTERRRLPGDAGAWAGKLDAAMREKALYRNPNLKLNDLAMAVHLPGHQLSQLLNEHVGKSFSTYINEFRVREACRLIAENDHLTVEAIGYEVGYNSKSTFYTAFKKVLATTPSAYRDQLITSRLQHPDGPVS
ncbi:helix-turn-helix domain-containing protein [Chitinophaga lutea]